MDDTRHSVMFHLIFVLRAKYDARANTIDYRHYMACRGIQVEWLDCKYARETGVNALRFESFSIVLMYDDDICTDEK